MSQHVDARAAAAEHSQESQRRSDGDPSAAPAFFDAPAPYHRETAEHTDSAENSRRRADRIMGRTLKISIGEITRCARCCHEDGSEPRAELPG